MKYRLFAVAAVCSLLIIVAGSVAAIPFGQPDGDAHPYVGLAVFDQGGGPAWRCSGTLISPTLFLTAAHCTSGAEAARVWFDADVQSNPEYPFSGSTSIDGTPIPHPNYVGLILPNTSDVGVVILSEPVNLSYYPSVAPVGYLDTFKNQRGQQDVQVTVVGYGLQGVKPDLLQDRIRYQGTVKINNITSALTDGWNVHLSNNPGQGHGGPGGTCFGDSGGPAFHGPNNYIIGVASFVLNQNCKGAGFNYRVDTQYAQDFINQYR